jgi:hypothetical protein
MKHILGVLSAQSAVIKCAGLQLGLQIYLVQIAPHIDERRLTGAVFLDLAKAFDTVWVKGLL